ncbi:tripartite tricarboxylate transporter substrate binding protein [Salibacterium aidingense]|uniref:tripartite tricarboxylate transporter substrate binding protein n=1 Tax=Salibacterium aidingense TaxID=384933 RepID=UPI003BD471BA
MEEGTGSESSASGSEGGQTQEESSADYPSHAIEFYVGFGPGGGTDLFARAVAEEMEDILDANINVINREGASGTVMLEEAANQPADGYTVAAISSFPVTTALETNENGLEVFQPLARFQADTFGLMSSPDTFKNLDEFVKEAKENPGEIEIGGVGSGGFDEMAAQIFIQETGLDLNYVPFDGSGDLQSALLGGNVDVSLEEIGPSIDYLESGEMTPLAFLSEERLEDFPDTPATGEEGWDVELGVERGFAVHKDTPKEIQKTLEEAMKEAYETDSYQEVEENSYLHYKEGWLNSEDYTEKLESDIELFSETSEDLE